MRSGTAESFFSNAPLCVVAPDGSVTRRAVVERLVWDESKSEGARRCVLALEGVRTRAAANAFRGAYLAPAKGAAPSDPFGATRGYDVFDAAGGMIGQVYAIESGEGAAVLVVRDASGVEARIAANWESVHTLDRRTRRIVVRRT